MKIRPIEQQYTAQGSIQGDRATPGDFGGNIGAAADELAGSMNKSAEVMTQLAEAKDQVWRSNAVSAFQLDQFQQMQAAKVDPDFEKKYGADGSAFASTFNNNIDDSINNLVSTAPSNRSAQQLRMELNGVKTNLMGHAISFQAETGGAYMKNQLLDSMQTDAKMVAQSPQDTAMVLERGKNAIAKAPFLTPEHKKEMTDAYEQNIALAAGKGMVLHSPEKVLAAIAPDVLSSFKPTPRVVANVNIPITNFQPARVTPAVNKYAPVTAQYAAQYSVDPNFMQAQQQAESAGNPDAVNNSDAAVTGSPSMGIAQFQPATAAMYGIDPTKPEQAIKGQAMYMADLLKQFGGDYRKAAVAYNWGPGNLTGAIATYGDKWAEHIPSTTQDYLAKIFSHAQPASTAEASWVVSQQQAQGEPSRADTNPDWFNKLDWQQQFQIVHEAEQGVRANQVRDSQTIALMKQQKEQQQQQIMNEMFNRIGTQENPLTVAEVRHSDLDYQGKEHMLDAINKVTKGENATDPVVFNDLFNRIHAPETDPNRISDDRALLPYAGGKGLSLEDLNKLRGELRGKNTPEGAALAELKKNFFTYAKGQIDSSTFINNDPVGKQKFYEFQQQIISTLDKETRSGSNPLELFDPHNSKYLGKYIQQYQRSPTQQMQDYSNFLQGNGGASKVAPRQPGETPAAYIERTGKAQ